MHALAIEQDVCGVVQSCDHRAEVRDVRERERERESGAHLLACVSRGIDDGDSPVPMGK